EWSWLVVVAAWRARSQSDNDYRTITSCYKLSGLYGPQRTQNLPGRRARTELFPRRREGAPDAACREPGGQPPRGRARRAAVRSVVEERHAHRGGTDARELRATAGAPRRRDRVGGARAARPAPRPRADRRQR